MIREKTIIPHLILFIRQHCFVVVVVVCDTQILAWTAAMIHASSRVLQQLLQHCRRWSLANAACSSMRMVKGQQPSTHHITYAFVACIYWYIRQTVVFGEWAECRGIRNTRHHTRILLELERTLATAWYTDVCVRMAVYGKAEEHARNWGYTQPKQCKAKTLHSNYRDCMYGKWMYKY